MDRKQFLRQLGLSGGALFAVYCTGLQGCSSQNVTPVATNVDFTLDLSLPANSALNANGGYVISNSVVVARTISGSFAAVTQICSHEGRQNVVYVKNQNEFYCSVHGATYDVSGKGTNSNGSNGLTTYKTSLNGTLLRVFS